jgi:hypothetical protein
MARSTDWWVLATAAAVATMAALVLICTHAAEGAAAHEDPISRALVGG